MNILQKIATFNKTNKTIINICEKYSKNILGVDHIAFRSLYKGMKQTTNSGKIEMNLEVDEVKTTLTNEETQKTLRSYTVVGKVLAADLLDMDKFQNHFLLTAASLGSQLLKNYDLGVNDKGEPVTLTFDKIRDFFFDILLGKIEVQEINGNFDISQITGKFS